MHKLEYVVSGTSYMRIANPLAANDPDTAGVINQIFDNFVNNHYSHNYSILYNAYQEADYGGRFEPYRDHIKNIHADSGGLQIVTQGKTITEELKEKVYQNQAEFADVGMCFDEIPIIMPSGKSDRNDVSGRYFDFENYEALARKTGNNIRKQVEIFDEKSSSCKSFAILQGNCYDTYMTWFDRMLSEVPQSGHGYIGGVAMGAAALGTGPLEDVKRAFIASQLPFRNAEGKLHLHVLGVGSVRRMIPYLIFCQNGLYDHVEISYDSTSHARAAENGLYFINGRTMSIGRAWGPNYELIYNDLNTVMDVGTTIEDFYNVLNNGVGDYKKLGGDLYMWMRVRTMVVAGSTRNFMRTMQTMLTDKDALLKYSVKMRLEHQFRNLYNIKSVDDFRRWESDQYLGGSMKSTPVRTDAPPSLEDLFS